VLPIVHDARCLLQTLCCFWVASVA
jgi:hypothetical protein